MSGIIERLRAAYCRAGCGTHEYCLCDMAEDAADEIERLQAELREAREALDAAMAMLYECQTADGAEPSDLFVAVAAFQCGAQNDAGREMIRAFLAK